ncbi:hypothetical protein J1N35_005244 [Gossypium stocksii]|uniref:RNase H type-1 domain-containing protein n=1 Tax=Gossypium stocksii TaxID=47602 RepID=A0A9D3WCI4_9ROSI|nr:hypothetical protein J1N35_005244 [Gossypium stocksii]
MLMVEAKTVLEGLKLAWDRGFKQVELECDNAMLIEFIWNGWASVSNVGEIRCIHEWCLKLWKVKSKHIQRDANKVANCIVKANGDIMDQLIIFEDPQDM